VIVDRAAKAILKICLKPLLAALNKSQKLNQLPKRHLITSKEEAVDFLLRTQISFTAKPGRTARRSLKARRRGDHTLVRHLRIKTIKFEWMTIPKSNLS
jgi:hypothetical protein